MRHILKTTVALLGLSTALSLQAWQLDQFARVGDGPTGAVTNNGGGNYTLDAGGGDIWAASDSFSFAYTEVTGDFDVKVRIEKVEAVARWCKIGIMARETLAGDSRYFFNRVAPAGRMLDDRNDGVNDWRVMYRTGLLNNGGVNGGEHEEIDGSNPYGAPQFPYCWSRIVRRGNVFYASNSVDNINWYFMGSQDTAGWNGGAMPQTLKLGLAGSRHPDAGGWAGNPDKTSLCEFRSMSLAVGSRGNPNGIYVPFPKAMDPATATNLANYVLTGPGSPVITNATITADGKLVRLRVNTALTDWLSSPTAVYSLAVSGLKDSTGADVAASTETFRHGEEYPAPSIFLVYTKETSLDAYKASANWTNHIPVPIPNNSATQPTIAAAIYTGRFAEDTIPETGYDNYSMNCFGYLKPRYTGDFSFAASSDDDNQLWLSTDEQPGNAVKIASQPNWAGGREYASTGDVNGSPNGGRGAVTTPPYSAANPPPSNISYPIHLVSGQKYYFSFMYHQGGGGNHGSATWDYASGLPFKNNILPLTAASFAETAPRLQNGAAYQFGPIAIGTQPSSRTNQDATIATFTCLATNGTPPYYYQWRKNNALIAGANSSTYATPPLPPEDNNAKFDCLVFNDFSSVTSRAVFLTVTVDLVPPTLSKAVGDSVFTNIFIKFSEAVTAASAQTVANYAVKDGSGNSLTVLTAKLAADGTNVVLTTTPQAEYTHYTVTVNNIKDTSSHNNQIANNSTVGFTSWLFTPGFLLMQVYEIGGGMAVSDLTNNAAYPNGAAASYYIPGFSSRWVYSDNAKENYGARISGYFVPPTSTDYTFYASGDDGHALWINPAGPSFNTMTKYFDTGTSCCEVYTASTTPSLAMSAGTRYAIQGVYKEQGGGDYLGVWVKETSDPTAPPSGQDANGAGSELKGAPGYFFGVYANPDIAPTITISKPLADTSRPWNSKVSFKVVASNSGGARQTYMWFTNGVQVAGNFTDTFITPKLTPEIDGMTVSVHVYVPGRVAISTATVSTYQDLESPTIVASFGSGSLGTYGTTQNFDIVFSEAMDALSLDSLNISLENNGIDSAVLDADEMTLHCVATTPISDGTVVTMLGGADLAGNVIIDNLTTVLVTWGYAREDFYGNFGGGTTIADLTNNTAYPKSPTEIHWVTQMESHCIDCTDNYGQRISAWLQVPVTADYTFWTASDDYSVVYLSTDENPGNRIAIAAEADWNSSREYNKYAGQKSAEYRLIAGKKYYIEGLMKEGGGGDNFAIAMSTNGVIANGDAPISGKWLSPAYFMAIDPATPADITVGQCYPVAETVKVSVLPQPIAYGINWYADVNTRGVFEWVNAGATIALPSPIPMELDGVQFYAVVTNELFANIDSPLSKVTSRTATLHVVAETKPALLGASSVSSHTVGLLFDKPVNGADGGESLNYSLVDAEGNDIASPNSAMVRSDMVSVLLEFADPVPASFRVKAINVTDCVGINPMDETIVAGQQWAMSTDIPAPVAPAGGTNFSWKAGDVEIIAGGADIWDVADQFHFVYNVVEGDFDVKVLVDRFEAANRYGKAGVMARMSLDASSPTIQVNTTPGNRVGCCAVGEAGWVNDFTGAEIETGVRSAQGGGTGGWEAYRVSMERKQAWVRLQRVGTVFNGFYSTNGAEWTKLAGPTTQEFATNNALYVGVSASSHNTAIASPAHFANIGTTVYPGGGITLVQAPEAVLLTNAGYSAILKATFAIQGSIPGTEPVVVRWQRNDGAGNWTNVATEVKFALASVETTYTTPGLTLVNDDGAQYRVVANVVSYKVASDVTSIFLLDDYISPKLTYAVSLGTNSVAVFFDKPMSAATADPAWWSVAGPGTVTVASVSTNANSKRIDLAIDAATPMVAGSTYTVTVTADSSVWPALGASDTVGNAIDPNPSTASFMALPGFPGNPDAIAMLPTANVLPLSQASQMLRGFDCRIVQTLANILGTLQDNDLAELLFSGLHPLAGTNIAGMPCFVENDVINYNWELNNLGHLTPDRPIPGVRIAPYNNSDNFTFEALTYIELKAGVYRLGVNSDDGFRVSPATSQADPNNNIYLGQFNGGRGSSDTWFDIYAPQDGLYPFRLMWMEGGGGANCEFLVTDLVSGQVTGINAQNSLKAFRPTATPVLLTTPVETSITYTLEGTNCLYVVPDLTASLTVGASALCGGTPVVGQVPAAGTLLGPGSYTLTVGGMTANWASNGVAIPVRVLDLNAPVIYGATNIEVLCRGGGAEVGFEYITVEDCDPATTLSISMTNGTFLTLGNYPVVVIARDTSGNATTNVFTVSVVDPLPPVITCPGDMLVTCVAGPTAVEFDVASSSVCDLDIPPVVCVPPSGTVFPAGETVVQCTTTANSGRSASCSFKVTVVIDTVPPTLTGCPSDFTVRAETNTAYVPYIAPRASDDCASVLAVACVPPSGADFPVGQTVVHCTTTDHANNTASCSFTVTVLSPVAPKVAYAVSLSLSNVAVYFDKKMSPSGADPLYWTLTGPGSASIMTVTPNAANARRYDLLIEPPLEFGSNYVLTAEGDTATASGVTDLLGVQPMPNPAPAPFVALASFPDDPNAITVLKTNGMMAPGHKMLRGFDCRMVQSAQGVLLGNSLAVAERVLAGTEPNQGANLAGLPCFVETGVINYNWEAAFYGHITPDKLIPGIPAVGSTYTDNIAMEALAYVSLKQGLYRLGVNSDDGFRVTSATSAADTGNTNIWGLFDGGRGTSDTWFDIYAPVDGLYPVRVIWQNGNGGANIEFTVYDLVTGGVTAVNADDSILAYRPTMTPSVLTHPADITATDSYTVTDMTAQFTVAEDACGGGAAVISQTPPAGTVLGAGRHEVVLSGVTPTGAMNYWTVIVEVASAAPARLAISTDGTQVVITWSKAIGSYDLVKSGQVQAAAGDWALVTEPAVSDGDNWKVSLPVGASNLFFQLRKH